MKYLKKIFYSLLLLEALNILFGFLSVGKSIILPLTNYNDHALYYDIDSLYGIAKLKNTKQLISYPWNNVIFETNSLGFRDDEFNSNGILVVGNSFVEGYGINKKDRFTEILETRIKTKFHNCGNSGVWSPIQSLVLIKDFVQNKRCSFDKVLLILTPEEVLKIGKRNPKKDFSRNFPYKQKNSIKFHKSSNTSFPKSLSNMEKIKRFSKNLFIIRCYRFFKYFGATKFKKREITYDKKNLKWFFNKIIQQKFEKKIDIILINNLSRTRLLDIHHFEKELENTFIDFKIIEFPDDLNNYFSSNGHLNEKGNKKLAFLIKGIL